MSARIGRPLAAAGLVVVVIAAAAAILLSRSSGNGDEATIVRDHVLSDSLKAAAQHRSYEVQVEGEVKQGGKQARFKLSYEYIAPDKLRWLSQSISSAGTTDTGLVVIANRWWDLNDGVWEETVPFSNDFSAFSADRIWGLVPFDSARTGDSPEATGDFQAWHYRVNPSGKLALDILAGSLLAGEEPAFEGELTEFKIDYWTEEFAGFPVQMKLSASGSGGSLNLTARLVRVNDSAISIEPPPGARSLTAAAAGTATSVAARVPTQAPAAVAPTTAPPPPTQAPPTQAPPTQAPPTSAPPTTAPPTSAPPTSAPPTQAPPQPTQPAAASPQPVASPVVQTGVQPAGAAPAPLPIAGSGGLVSGGTRTDIVGAGFALIAASLVLGKRALFAPAGHAGPDLARRRRSHRGALLAGVGLLALGLLLSRRGLL